jgi:hypothetical protein
MGEIMCMSPNKGFLLEYIKQLHESIKKTTNQARHQWLMPVILAVWEAKIRRTEV